MSHETSNQPDNESSKSETDSQSYDKILSDYRSGLIDHMQTNRDEAKKQIVSMNELLGEFNIENQPGTTVENPESYSDVLKNYRSGLIDHMQTNRNDAEKKVESFNKILGHFGIEAEAEAETEAPAQDKPMWSDEELGRDEVDQITPAVYEQIKQQSKDLSIDDNPESPAPSERSNEVLAKGMQDVFRKAELNKANREKYKKDFIGEYPSDIKLLPVNSQLKAPSHFGGIISRFSRLHNMLKSGSKSEKETFKHQDVVQYDGNQLSLEFKTKGDVLPMGTGSEHKYAKNFDLEDMAIITTKSGKEYGIAKGFIIDKSSGKVSKLPRQAINLIIGKRGELPGIGRIDQVKNVQLRYKIGDDQTAERRFEPNPFEYYKKIADEQTKDES